MKGFREEFEEIEKAFVAERAALLQQHISAWVLQRFRVNLKTFLGLAMPNQCCHAVRK